VGLEQRLVISAGIVGFPGGGLAVASGPVTRTRHALLIAASFPETIPVPEASAGSDYVTVVISQTAPTSVLATLPRPLRIIRAAA
jgi:hypothetical protein